MKYDAVDENPVCGKILPRTKLVGPGYKDIRVDDQDACFQACRDDKKCVAASYKGNGGCWLRKEFSGTKRDTDKTTFILCPDDNGALT